MQSLWLENTEKQVSAKTLQEDTHTDVCVIGGGICGIVTAYYLLKQGKRVVVLEKDTIGSKATGHTTAKITSQHGAIYAYMVEKYGIEFAKQYFAANEEAIRAVWDIVKENQIECALEKQDNYLYARTQEEETILDKEWEALNQITNKAELVTQTGLPFPVRKAIQLKEQAQFHPIQYIQGVAKAIRGMGGEIYEQAKCEDIRKEKEGYACQVGEHTVYAPYVVIASHYPFLVIPGLYFAKMYQASSYVIAVDMGDTVGSGMYINPSNPIFSYRTVEENGKKLVLLGGAGHKTGKPVTEADTYAILEQEAKTYYPQAKVEYKWSTRDCVTLDKLPYIGELSTTMPNVYVGTGFNKWGMTSSHVAAQIIADKIVGKSSPYEDIFKATRMHPIVNREEVKNMVVDVTKGLVQDRLGKTDLQIKYIPKDAGGIVEIKGEKVGIYKDEKGKIYAVKPVCTHLGCILEWNDADKTWDCPCHGSRFRYDGKDLYEPANKALERIENGKNLQN